MTAGDSTFSASAAGDVAGTQGMAPRPFGVQDTQVNTWTVSGQAGPSVAGLAGGDYVVY